MGIFSAEAERRPSPSEKVVLPLYKFSSTPVVLLPGILYRVIFSQQEASNLLSYFKSNHRIKNVIISNLSSQQLPEPEMETQLSEECITGSRSFKKFFSGENGGETGYDWLIIGLVPRESKDSVCVVSRIVGVVNDSKSFIITFQALVRGEVLSPSLKSIKAGTPYEASIKVVSNTAVDLNASTLAELVTKYNTKTEKLFKVIDEFRKEYTSALSLEKETSHGRRYALTLSPLANSLSLQFDGEYRTAHAKLVNLISNFNGNYELRKSAKNTELFLKLLDLTVAILPVEKLKFLDSVDLKKRIEVFFKIIDEFLELFDVLNKSVDYVENFYSHATDVEKSKVIANQLKSIRFSLGTLRTAGSKTGIAPASGPRTNNRFVPGNGAAGGAGADDESEELQLIENFVNNIPADVSPDGVKLLTKDLKRLKRMPSQHSEYQVLRTYFDNILDIPFGQYVNSKETNIAVAEKQLNDDHYGLYHVKKRLLQYLSVLKLHEHNDKVETSAQAYSKDDEPADFVLGDAPKTPSEKKEVVKKNNSSIKSKSPILLFAGPPGVGKTSLAKSIATTLGRKFQRVSLGGVRDESEIRGHRRTYVGSMPGVIVNALRKAGSMNPVILLDEIDKVCGGTNSAGRINGDPAAALLEVLDPEQNSSFTDHYVGFPVDLSNVLFLCTANDLSTISPPLRDRTEIIEISGYTAEEKINIGAKYLLPKQVKFNGLPNGSVLLGDGIWKKIVLEYIREAGVRNLERNIAAICRGKAVEYVEKPNSYNATVSSEELVKYIGLPNHPISKDLLTRPKFSYKYGVVNGLSYNSDGSGSVLVFEVISIPFLDGNKNSSGPSLILTGRLGETLTESIKIGINFVKSIISRNLIEGVNSREVLKNFNNSELHLHVPMGGVSKDGPSAGITITLALLSVALGKEVNPAIAMTGEITLRGKVLPIGGISEKLLGASLFDMKTVLVPKLNRKDIIETFYSDNDEKLVKFLKNENTHEPEQKVKEKLGIDIIYVDTFWDVIKAVWGDEISISDHPFLQTNL